MKKILILAIALSFTSAFGQNLNIRLAGILQDSVAKSEIFREQILFPADQPTEVFTGPYTIRFSGTKISQREYQIKAELSGLGPEFHYATYELKIPLGDSLPIMSMPVKGKETVGYVIELIDDTSHVISNEPPTSDTTSWNTSMTVHYQTHFLINSYADFLWNLKMGFLENIYNRYRSSFKLSEFDKIEYYFHPNPLPSFYPPKEYVIQPKTRRIDVLFSPDLDAATPRPASELLLYRMWGYGPRWMVTGFAGYYEDNFLLMRNLAEKFKPSELAAKFADDAWVDRDTGRIVTGAFSRWLADSELFSKFMELYRQSTELSFPKQFEEIYLKSFEKASQEFLDFSKTYRPKEVELEYYGTEYMGRGNYARAREYFDEACKLPNSESKPINQLALCEYWLGDYKEASGTLEQIPPDTGCARSVFETTLGMASGKLKQPSELEHLTGDSSCVEAGILLSDYYLDKGQVDKAEKMINRIGANNSPDYYIALGRLKVLRGQRSDSTLAMAAALAMARAQEQASEPVNYYLAGQAFLLMKKFDQAKENLDISIFLEKRPYFQGLTLLELGKLSDLRGDRNTAKECYDQVLMIKSGAYQKSLAKEYLKKKFEL